jgi:hypothetical protein
MTGVSVTRPEEVLNEVYGQYSRKFTSKLGGGPTPVGGRGVPPWTKHGARRSQKIQDTTAKHYTKRMFHAVIKELPDKAPGCDMIPNAC